MRRARRALIRLLLLAGVVLGAGAVRAEPWTPEQIVEAARAAARVDRHKSSIAAFRRAGSFRGDAAVTTWLHRVVVNACLDRLRAAKIRRLEAMLIVMDARTTYLLSGNGDLIEPDDGIIAIGSGGAYASAAAKALARHTDLDARQIAAEAMAIAASICIYTNSSITIEVL